MKLTVVTATFNCIRAGNGAKLQRCIESVSSLKCEHEHLIMDGASIDGTAELARRVGSEHNMNELHIFSEKDGGIYEALNKGLARASGEWFYVLGADDCIVHPGILEGLIVSAGDEDVIVAPVDRDGKANYQFHGYKDLWSVFLWVSYCHQGVLMRTNVVKRFGGFDESYRMCADADLFLKCHTNGVYFRYTFRSFANFSAGGLCESDGELAEREAQRYLAANFGLSSEEAIRLRKERKLPLRVISRYILGHDLALRIGSRYMLLMYLKWWCRRLWRFVCG